MDRLYWKISTPEERQRAMDAAERNFAAFEEFLSQGGDARLDEEYEQPRPK